VTDAAEETASLRAVPLFATLGGARLTRLIGASTMRTVDAGAMIAARGQAADRLIVVEAGTLLAVHDTEQGRRLRLGEYPAPCTVDKAAVPARELLTLIDDVPAVRRHVLAYLAGQVDQRQRDLVRAAFDDTVARVAGWLLDATRRSGPRVVLLGGQEGLAEAVGATRVSVNRALQALARDRLIRIEPGAVTVLQAARLADGAGSGARPSRSPGA
jgi:CRP/FNR family transcriptional regulator, cyclic AMP receptor protein